MIAARKESARAWENVEELQKFVRGTKKRLIDLDCLEPEALFAPVVPMGGEAAEVLHSTGASGNAAALAAPAAAVEGAAALRKPGDLKRERSGQPVEESLAHDLESAAPPDDHLLLSPRGGAVKTDIHPALFDVQRFHKRVNTIIAQYEFTDILGLDERDSEGVTLIDRLQDPAHVEKELLDTSFEFMKVLMNYIESEDFEQIGNVIVTLFEANNMSFALFEWLITRELRYHTGDEHTLFREDNFNLKILSTYLKVAGKQYLTRILGPTVREVEKRVKDMDWNRQAAVAQAIAVNFTQHLDEAEISCPGDIRILCALLKREVINVAPGSVLVGLGNIVFLRWIGPAIVHPERYGVVDYEPSVDTRRLLVQVAKLVLSCVNAIYCPDPTTLDPWVAEHCTRILQFLIKLPKRVHRLRKTVGQLKSMEELQLFREVRARHSISLQRLFQYIQVNSEGLARSWKEVKEEEKLSNRTVHQLYQKRLMRTLSGYGVEPSVLFERDMFIHDGAAFAQQIADGEVSPAKPKKTGESLASQLNAFRAQQG
mmetsp:Transcript_16351/g.63824  ORF Transcript_16351/g.63824 Transcript_16351/m.63824 type:complete len:542 (+) Transcript_16351:101-1726(+)